MSFDVSADAYLRFMGRYSEPLAARFADLAGIRPGQRVLDVGCGPGALAAELVSRVGAGAVSAVEPSASFVAAARDRLPGVDIRRSPAEQLPFGDGVFDAAMAQLVVHFMTDPVAGLREMGRVTRPGARVRPPARQARIRHPAPAGRGGSRPGQRTGPRAAPSTAP